MISVNRNDDAFPMTGLGEDMMAAVDTLEHPTASLEKGMNSLPETCFI